MKHSAIVLVMLMAGILAFSGCASDNTIPDSTEPDVSVAESSTVTETAEILSVHIDRSFYRNCKPNSI